jgi:hypothetical protein
MDTQSNSNIGPKFRLDVNKYFYLLKNLSPNNQATETKDLKSRPIKLDKVNWGKFEGIGNLHFHNQTLRHNSGEFTMNRIYSSAKRSKKLENSDKSHRKYKNSGKRQKKSPVLNTDEIKSLLNKTQRVLSNKTSKKKFTIKGISFENKNPYQVKSREYIKTYRN